MLTDEDFARWEAEQPEETEKQAITRERREDRLQAQTDQYKRDVAMGRTTAIPEENIAAMDEDAEENPIDMDKAWDAIAGERGITSPEREEAERKAQNDD